MPCQINQNKTTIYKKTMLYTLAGNFLPNNIKMKLSSMFIR
jgi:hypothetical protein